MKERCSVQDYILFNNALNTFYLRLYDIRHMVKDHTDSERKPAATTTWATLSDYMQRFFYMHHLRQDNTYHSLCYTSLGTLAGVRNSSVCTKLRFRYMPKYRRESGVGEEWVRVKYMYIAKMIGLGCAKGKIMFSVK